MERERERGVRGVEREELKMREELEMWRESERGVRDLERERERERAPTQLQWIYSVKIGKKNILSMTNEAKPVTRNEYSTHT